MAIKDVKLYYDSICDDYSEMLESLRDMEKEAQEGLVSPEKVEQLKTMIQPIKDNYMRISYIMFLLNKPTKFDLFLSKLGLKTNKVKFSEKIDSSSTLEAIKKENKEVINSMTFDGN